MSMVIRPSEQKEHTGIGVRSMISVEEKVQNGREDSGE